MYEFLDPWRPLKRTPAVSLAALGVAVGQCLEKRVIYTLYVILPLFYFCTIKFFSHPIFWVDTASLASLEETPLIYIYKIYFIYNFMFLFYLTIKIRTSVECSVCLCLCVCSWESEETDKFHAILPPLKWPPDVNSVHLPGGHMQRNRKGKSERDALSYYRDTLSILCLPWMLWNVNVANDVKF